MKTFSLFLMFTAFTGAFANASCTIYDSNGNPSSPQEDSISLLLSKEPACPKNVEEFNLVISNAGLTKNPSMVANRGRNNPTLGSFSFFESVTGPLPGKNIHVKSGEFFYGHFTDINHAQIILDQSPAKDKLLIELIAWDYHKKIFNFYEMRGLDQKSTRWFYRGNSVDALKDNRYLYRDSGSAQKYGSIMRCSACHSSGGPIMKELSYPHNDWWTSTRPLGFGNNQLTPEAASYIKQIRPAEYFAADVKQGMHLLEKSVSYQNSKSTISLQEQLRPLFCENEINIESDLELSESKKGSIKIPSAFFANPMLGNFSITINRSEYGALLEKFKMNFPETSQMDADHAWLTPVKGYSDLMAIQSLIQKKVIDENFALKILSIDQENPIFSKKRCALLRSLPDQKTTGWENQFLKKIAPFLYQKGKMAADKKRSLLNYFLKLNQVRDAAFASEISKNPKGQILEPGFRVIFPVSSCSTILNCPK